MPQYPSEYLPYNGYMFSTNDPTWKNEKVYYVKVYRDRYVCQKFWDIELQQAITDGQLVLSHGLENVRFGMCWDDGVQYEYKDVTPLVSVYYESETDPNITVFEQIYNAHEWKQYYTFPRTHEENLDLIRNSTTLEQLKTNLIELINTNGI